jgi:hypothetical protein
MLEIDTSLATFSALTFEKMSSSLVAIQCFSSSHLDVVGWFHSFKPCLFALLKCTFFKKSYLYIKWNFRKWIIFNIW